MVSLLPIIHPPNLEMGRLAGHKPRAGKRLPGFRTPGLERLAGHTPRAGGIGRCLLGCHAPGLRRLAGHTPWAGVGGEGNGGRGSVGWPVKAGSSAP